MSTTNTTNTTTRPTEEPWVELDIAFFEAHPGEHQYTRDFHPSEWAQIAGPDRPVPPGARVLVRQIQPGLRMRHFQTGPLKDEDVVASLSAAAAARELLAKVQP